MRTISVTDHLDARPAEVWAVLADFPNISVWNQGVRASHATGEASGGVGATRHCDLAPMGKLEETVEEWEPERRMVVRIDQARRLPIRDGATATFVIAPDGNGSRVTVEYAYEPQLGLLGPAVDRQMAKGFTGFLADLGAAARSEPVG